MPKVFVHGNPETAFVWSPLVRELEARGVSDIIMLSPPGFGAPVPEGFGGTRLEHRDWLIGEIEKIGEPIDLLGHDWGAGHTYAVAAERPDLLRSWAADVAGLIHPDYEWHPNAAVWQREGEGEESIAQMIAMSADELATNLAIPEALAASIAEHLDERMGQAILNVYRSAVQPAMRELGDALAEAERRAALLIDAAADVYVPPEMVNDVSPRIRAQILTLPDTGHWWMWESTSLAADGLVAFWSIAD